MVTVCQIATRTTPNTTAPKNHSALDPLGPGLKKINQQMARLPATPQLSQPRPRQPPIAASGRRGGGSVGSGGIGEPFTWPGCAGPAALAICAGPVTWGLPSA